MPQAPEEPLPEAPSSPPAAPAEEPALPDRVVEAIARAEMELRDPAVREAAERAMEEARTETEDPAVHAAAATAAATALRELALGTGAGAAVAPAAAASEAVQLSPDDGVRAARGDVRAAPAREAVQGAATESEEEGAPSAPSMAAPPARAARPVATPAKPRPRQDADISNLELVGELQDHWNAVSSEKDKNEGIFVGVNYFEVYRTGKRAQKEKLLTTKSLEEWRKHLAGLALAELQTDLLVTEEGDRSHDVKIGDELLHCRFYGVDFKDAPGDAGDPRAMLLPQVMCGLIFPHPYLYVYAHLSAMPKQQMEDETYAAAPDLKPSSDDEEEGALAPQDFRTRPSYYPETIYEHPNGSRHVIAAGYYTQDQYMSKSVEEQELLQAAVETAAEKVEASRTENWIKNASAPPAAPPPSPPPEVEPSSDSPPPGSPMPRHRRPVIPSDTVATLPQPKTLQPPFAAPSREEVLEKLDVALEPVYVLVSQPSPETLGAAANDPELLKIWPYAATPELCTHEPSDDAPDVCKHSGYAIMLQRALRADGDGRDDD